MVKLKFVIGEHKVDAIICVLSTLMSHKSVGWLKGWMYEYKKGRKNRKSSTVIVCAVRICLANIRVLMMVVVSTSEASVNFYGTT
jgi:LytS/YehU family sensor histidine kinase